MDASQKNDIVLFKQRLALLRDVKAGFVVGDGLSCNDDAERWGYGVGGVILDSGTRSTRFDVLHRAMEFNSYKKGRW